jgi:D-serine deaminase-like pyridoxal phosphate-dependent protein
MNDYDLHAHLIGQQGARRALNTPALIIDRDTLARNIAVMAAFAAAKGVRLRPHAKTHKSAHIAKLQVEAGATGVCCAKLGEAEALAEMGVENVLLTSPVVHAPAIERLAALHAGAKGLMVVADHPANVDAIEAAVRGAPRPLPVLVDIDPGIRRTGVATPEAAVELAARIQRSPSLAYAGVQFYCGVQQHIASFADRRAAIEERTLYLRNVVDLLTEAGAAPGIITGSGTGTHRIDAELGVFTEWQVGSYVFMDRQYNECDLGGDGLTPYETALFVDARVISANTPGMATIDAGFKALATDGGPPTIVGGAPSGAVYAFMGDEHGAVFAPDADFALGSAVALAVPHCDPTVNLYDFYHVVRGDTLVDIWPVTARGRSR